MAIDERKRTFFKLLFGEFEGYVCIAHLNGKNMLEEFFNYPQALDALLEHVESVAFEYNTYFCAQLLGKQRRRKEDVTITPFAWSDLDECPPGKVLVRPSIALESSPGRYQAFWKFSEHVDPNDAEEISRRIAYYHQGDGADTGGWDLTQLLRIPYTNNHKYTGIQVRVEDVSKKKYSKEEFDVYPQAQGFEYLEVPYPDEIPSAEDVLKEHRVSINPAVWTLYYNEPENDWSRSLWQLELLLFESGLTEVETLGICRDAACNKYRRDNRNETFLWKEILKAKAHVDGITHEISGAPDQLSLPALTTADERIQIEAEPGFVEEYIEWAKTLGDAAWQYHQVGAFMILACLLAGSLRLPTSYGTLVPNLWFMILADTTLTRKTTAMDIAVDLIIEIDPDAILATDGSIEGLFQSLSTRPARSSLFLRDEFSGLLEAMIKKDYYAGMAETLTKLYDGKFQKRVLRREIIEVRDPILNLFAGGIRTKIYELLRYEHVSSGFLPRFMFVGADSDITRLRPLGPPTDRNIEARTEIIGRLKSLVDHYDQDVKITVGEKTVLGKQRWYAKLTDDAWVRYNRYEADLVQAGLNSDRPDLMTPTFDRAAKSGLKMSLLISAARDPTEEEFITIEEQDIVRAFYYIEQWLPYTLDLMENIGIGASERQMEKIHQAIVRLPGITRSKIMQNFHLTSRDANLIFDTLEQRGLVTKQKIGRAEQYRPAGVR